MVEYVSAIAKQIRHLATILCLALIFTLCLSCGTETAIAAPACRVPNSGNWNINSDCDLVRDESAPRNVQIRNGSTLSIPRGRSLNINLSNFNLRVASDSKLLVEPGGKIGSCTVNSDRPRNEEIGADPNLDGDRFIEVIREKLPLSKHMGYVVSLQNSDLRNVAWDASGYAISNCDDPEEGQPFTIDTATAWGSVSKLITATVVTKLAQDSDQVDLGDRFAPYVPDRWNIDAKFNDVTFAQLLGHRAGLRKSADSNLRTRLEKTYPYPSGASAVAEEFKNRCPPRNKDNSPDGKAYGNVDPEVGVRCYSNSGAGIAGRMMMRAINPGGAQAWEQQNARTSDNNYDEEFKKWSSLLYLGLTDSQVLRPANIDFGREANCNIRQFRANGQPYARSYISGQDPDGQLKDDGTLTCFSGGWVMSARHMARFMRTLRHSDAIVNRATYREMTDCGIGFDGSLRNVNGGVAFGKNGLVPLGSGSSKHNYAAYVVMLPGGYTAVAASNSGNSSDLRNALIAAFNASYSPPGPVRVSSSSCPYW